MDIKGFIERLTLCLDNKGMTRKAWCADFGIPGPTIGNWIQRGSIPSVELVYRIAQYFGVSMEWLLTGKDTCIDDTTATMIVKFNQLSPEQKQTLITVADSLIKQKDN
jgi:transcriptional regulator with XRE-family HTH domain